MIGTRIIGTGEVILLILGVSLVIFGIAAILLRERFSQDINAVWIQTLFGLALFACAMWVIGGGLMAEVSRRAESHAVSDFASHAGIQLVRIDSTYEDKDIEEVSGKFTFRVPGTEKCEHEIVYNFDGEDIYIFPFTEMKPFIPYVLRNGVMVRETCPLFFS